jgi:phage-related protein
MSCRLWLKAGRAMGLNIHHRHIISDICRWHFRLAERLETEFGTNGVAVYNKWLPRVRKSHIDVAFVENVLCCRVHGIVRAGAFFPAEDFL